jgi:branched-chain amino acid transport system substrate-binding protein
MAKKLPTPPAVVSLIFVLFGAAGCERRPSTVLIGHLAPLNGPDRERGLAAVRGVQLAVDEINDDKDQWIAGHRIAVMHTDTKGDPTVCENQAVRLASVNKVSALIGGDTREQMARLLPVTREYGLWLVSPSGMAGTSAHASALGLSLDQKVQAIAKLLATGPKPIAVAILADSHDTGVAAAVEQLSSIVTSTQVPVTVRRFKDDKTLDQTGDQFKDTVVFFGSAKDLIAWGQKHPKPRKLIFAGDETEAQSLCEEPSLANCLALGATPAAPQTPAAKSFAENYKKQFGAAPPIDATRYYDAVRFLCRAASEAKSFTPDKLLPKLKSVTTGERLSGKYSTGPDQVAHGAVYVLQVKNGQLVDHPGIETEKDKNSSPR